MSARALIAIAIAAVFAGVPACAQDAEQAVTEANALYRDGQFEQAVAAYRKALEAGLDGPRVQYNLGNALFRGDQIGPAIAHYQAALTMAPRDRDIRANLDRALAERPAGRPAPSVSWLHAAAARIVAAFTLSEFAVAAAICWWGTLAAVVALLIGVRRRRTARRIAVVLAVLTLALSGLAIARWWAFHHVQRAVVIVESAQVRTGPGESFEVALPVQEGWTLRVLQRDTDWARVRGEGGASGWLPTSSITMVGSSVVGTGAADG